MLTRRYRIEGRVQGVYFRASTREQAVRLNMDGHALNLPDGSVEVVARGSEAAHRELEAWLRQGPPSARVDAVRTEIASDPVSAGFRTG